MNWQGKAIGGSIGSFLGPWGAIVGATAGHFLIDRKAPTPEKQRLRLLAVTAAALYELAGVDGHYTAKEDKAIRTILADINGALGTALEPHELAYLIDDAARIDHSLARLAAEVRENHDLARASAVWLWRVAVSDGDETAAETDCLGAFARQVGLSEDEMRHASMLFSRQTAHDAKHPDRRAACSVLGIPYNADAAQIKSAYRTLSQTYHPDKHAGLDPAIRALTAEKFAQIKAAYDTLSDVPSYALYAKEAKSGHLIPAEAETVVQCFTCGQAIRLPASPHSISARCPVCQTLLAFERHLAEQLV